MTIICPRQHLTFVNHGKWDKKANKLVGGSSVTVDVKPQGGAQEVPDWIKDTPTFKAASNAGLIVQVNIVAPAPQTVTAPTAEPETGMAASAPTSKRGRN